MEEIAIADTVLLIAATIYHWNKISWEKYRPEELSIGIMITGERLFLRICLNLTYAPTNCKYINLTEDFAYIKHF